MAQHCSTTKVLENGRVSPPSGTVATTVIPLSFLDTLWLSTLPMQRLLFYQFPHPTSHFIQITLPRLKDSLSLTLQHFFPFAGNLRLPPLPQRPYIFFTDGDSLPFIVTESDADFNHLISNHPKHGLELQALVPKLPSPSVVSDGTVLCKQLPLMAIQVTIFPKAGFCIGITFFHSAADGKSLAYFTKSWASICESKGDLSVIENNPPIHTRDLVEDLGGIWSIFVDQSEDPSTDTGIIPTDKLRVTYTIGQSKVSTLKNWITSHNKKPVRLSTFVVTCAYIWVCLTKLQEAETSEIDDNSSCHFIFLADCRDRLKLPEGYFGNCLQPCIATVKLKEMLAENGVIVAANAIGEVVMELDNNGVMKEAEKWLSRILGILRNSKHLVSVGGSPKLRVYEMDFWWGRPMKTEVAHIGSYGSFSMGESCDDDGVEFGFALDSHQVDEFNAIFEQGFTNL